MQRPLFICDHSERLLCPIPLKVEPYSQCAGRCAYCSRNGLRSSSQAVRANSVAYIEKYFYRSKDCMEAELIRQRSPVQIGPTSDPLQPVELVARNTLKILKILRERGYPSVITTKYPHILTRPEYLQALDGLPLVVQCSVSSENPDILAALEPEAPPLHERLEALRTLHESGVHVQIRLWPFAEDLAGNLDRLFAAAHDAGVKTVLCNPLKIYHNGGQAALNDALGADYLAETHIKFVNGGVFSIASYPDQMRALRRALRLCRAHSLDLLTCDDFIKTRNWRDCCGVGGIPGFKASSSWAYYVNGYRITDHTDFETYMSGLDCPWHAEFEQEWNRGKLARALPDVVFHPEDQTYSRIER